MDWLTFTAATFSALLSGGIVGGLVSLRIAKRESLDRREVLALEREKWEHQRDQPVRDAQRESLSGGLTAVSEVRNYIFECNKDHELLEAMEGDFHVVRLMSGQLHRAASDLVHHGLSEEAEGVFELLEVFGETINDFDNRYSELFNQCLLVSDALESRLARTY